MNNIISKVRRELLNNSDEKTKNSSQRFFKEPVITYGVKSASVKKISKDNYNLIKERDKDEIFSLCEEFWKSGMLEESFIACDWSHLVRKKYEEKDFDIFLGWLKKYINNWASCDTFCNHTIGAFIEMYPEFLSNLKILAKSDNRWERRAAAVSLIVPARKGMFLEEIFEIADILLLDKDDLVQKGYGWLLKVATYRHEQEVFEYVMKNKKVMPRTALRYAIEKMPKDKKETAMMKQ